MNHVLEHGCGDLVQGWLLLEKYPGCRAGVPVALRCIPERSQIAQLQDSSHAPEAKQSTPEAKLSTLSRGWWGGQGQHPLGERAGPGLVLWDHVLPGKPLIAHSEIIARTTLSCLPVMS